jgi:hypothetical protein
MATVWTSALYSVEQYQARLKTMVLLVVGLLFPCVRLLLIWQVTDPQVVAFGDIRDGGTLIGPFRLALGKWWATAQAHQGQYLLRGAEPPTTVRQFMIIEKMTRIVLVRALQFAIGRDLRLQLHDARETRTVTLADFRTAAAQVASTWVVLQAVELKYPHNRHRNLARLQRERVHNHCIYLASTCIAGTPPCAARLAGRHPKPSN